MLNNSLTHQDVMTLPLAILFHRCQEETSLFLSRKTHDPGFGYELFRRAAEGDEAAWECIYQQYTPLVAHWIERNPAVVYSDEEVQYLVNRTFERMWRQLSAQTFDRFVELKQLLRYLELCAHSCLLDFNRQKKGRTETPLEMVEQGHPAIRVEAEAEKWGDGQRIELWRVLLQLITDEAERVVLVASFILNLKPGQIQEQYGQHFATVVDVYRIKQNILQRLRRAPQLQQFVL